MEINNIICINYANIFTQFFISISNSYWKLFLRTKIDFYIIEIVLKLKLKLICAKNCFLKIIPTY